MALASAKQLLDELMGRDRNLTPSDKVRSSQWDLPDVCKHFLVKFCPNDLFVNTKADLGPCSKVHDDKMRKDYEKSSRYKQMGYEEDFLRFCQGMLSDVEKRIRRAKQRLALGNQDGSNNTSVVARNTDDKTQLLTERINELLEQVEQLGYEGKVEEAQGIMKLCDQLKEEREVIRKANEPNHWLQQTAEIAAAQEKQMEVCEVCGAFLIVGDAQQRVDDHLMGKQHVGYAKLKAAVEEILHKREKDKEEREKQREKEREDRQKQKDEEDRVREERRKQAEEERRKEKDRHRDKDRGRHRSKSRDRRHSSPVLNRSRSRRSRSKDRKHSSHKGHARRSSSKDRGRDRTHRHSRDSRRSRSHSRSRDLKRAKRSHSNSPNGRRMKQSHRDSSPDKKLGSFSPSSRRDSSSKHSSEQMSAENGDASGSDRDSSRMDDQSSQ